MQRNNRSARFGGSLPWRVRVVTGLGLAVLLGTVSLLVQAGSNSPDHIPSYVAWTPETIAAASSGDAFQGMLLAKRCDHCHGAEGFSAVASIPNLAGINRLAIWKQLEDYRTHKRLSHAMAPIAESLSPRDEADVVAYYARLPVFSDPQDNRIFPQARPVASGLVWRWRARHSAVPGLPRPSRLSSRSAVASNPERRLRSQPARSIHGPEPRQRHQHADAHHRGTSNRG